jgi:nucleoside-diphosphate-sugar epimerase
MASFAELGPVLVTGAAGFVGANLVRALLERGAEVHVILRAGASAWRLVDVQDRLRRHEGDLLEADFVDAAVAAARPALVYHLAAHGAYERQAQPRRILDTNIVGTLNLIEACERHGVSLLVGTGSSSEYGFKSRPMCEDDVLEPASYYAVGKAAQTHLCRLAAQRGRLRTVVLRLFSVYGPWEDPARLVPTIIRRARAGLPLDMTAPDIVRDFIYVDDVLEAMLDVPALQQVSGDVVNRATGVQTRLDEFVALVRELLASRSEVRWGGTRPRGWDTTCWVGDPARARARLGWSARRSLREGLGRMAEWMQRVGDDYGPAPGDG